MITLKIATPTERIFDGECNQVEIKTTSGNITVLPNHAPLVTTIDKGYVKIDRNEKLEIAKGLCVVGENSKVEIIVTNL